jgi:myo-inositol-1(or 4)-monophosphatase
VTGPEAKSRPLTGLRVLVTRPEAQSGPLARRLASLGAEVVLAPLIKTAPPASWTPLDRALRRLASADAVVFTSANAVEAFFARARRVLGRRPPAPPRAYAVGSATARALEAAGWRAAALPEAFNGAALARRMGRVRGRRVLIPRSDIGREDLPRLLRRAGARLELPVAYRTVPDRAGTLALRRAATSGFDWALFASPSAARAFAAALGKDAPRVLKAVRTASIGPATSAALRDLGTEPSVEANPSTAAGLAAAVAAKAAPAPAAALRRTLVAALRAAGREMRRGFLKAKVSYKGRSNPVTEADHAAEQAILDVVLRGFPGHDFLTEERAPRASGSDYVWVVDPIDGTLNYAHGFPHSCASVAVVRRGVAVLGGVYDPARDELFLAERGKGATLNGRPLRVAKAAKLADALLVTGFSYDRHVRAAEYAGYVRRFLEKAQDLRRSGSAALDLAWLAAGRVDGYYELHLNPWDVAAGRLLVEEAGGTVTDFSGRPWSQDPRTWGRQTLASNGPIHRAMLAVLGR